MKQLLLCIGHELESSTMKINLDCVTTATGLVGFASTKLQRLIFIGPMHLRNAGRAGCVLRRSLCRPGHRHQPPGGPQLAPSQTRLHGPFPVPVSRDRPASGGVTVGPVITWSVRVVNRAAPGGTPEGGPRRRSDDTRPQTTENDRRPPGDRRRPRTAGDDGRRAQTTSAPTCPHAAPPRRLGSAMGAKLTSFQSRV